MDGRGKSERTKILLETLEKLKILRGQTSFSFNQAKIYYVIRVLHKFTEHARANSI